MADNGNDMNAKVGMDTTAFKTGVTELNSQIRSVETSFRASAAVMGDWSNTSDGLKERTASLSEKLELQKQKLNILHDEYTKLSTAEGDNSRAMSSLANQMFSAEKAISSTESSLKKYDEQLKKVDDSGKKVDFSKLKSGLSGIGSGVGTGIKAAGTAIAGVGAAAAGAAVGVYKMASSAGENASQLKVMSEKTGMTAEQLQEYQYSADKLGISLDTITGVQSKLVKNMASAQSGTKAQSTAFKELGVSVTDSNGNLRDQNEVFSESINALGKVQNETQRNAIAMQIFGKSATNLNPLIAAGGDKLTQYAQEAKNTGAVMSDASINGLAKFKDGTAALKDSISGMVGTLASMALPALNNFTSLVGKLTGALNTALKTGNFSQFGTALSNGITSAIGQLSGITSKIVPVVTQVLSSAVNALVTAIPKVLPALTNGVVQLIKAATQILQQNGPMLIKAATQAVITLVKGLIQALPQIMQAAVQMITTLVNSLSQQLPTLIPIAVNAIITIVNGLLSNLPQIIQAAIQIIVALIQGIMNALPQLIAEVPKIIMGIITGLVSALPQLIAAAPKIIVSIITGLIEAIPLLIADAPQIIIGIITGLIQALPELLTMGPKILIEVWNGLKSQNWGEIGNNLIKGIVDGFKNAWGYLTKGVSDIKDKVVNSFKDLFGIHSPSAVMRDEIGSFLGLGIVEGIKSTVGQAADAMKSLTAGGGNINVGYSLAGAGAYGSNQLSSLGSSPITNHNYYGAQQQVTVLSVSGKEIARAVQPNISTGLANVSFRRRRSLGYAN